MRKFTRTLSCTLIAALLLTVAATAAACGKKAEYPTVSEVTGSQAVGEVIPAVTGRSSWPPPKRQILTPWRGCICPARRWTMP